VVRWEMEPRCVGRGGTEQYSLHTHYHRARTSHVYKNWLIDLVRNRGEWRAASTKLVLELRVYRTTTTRVRGRLGASDWSYDLRNPLCYSHLPEWQNPGSLESILGHRKVLKWAWKA